jgi:hypothetical protein
MQTAVAVREQIKADLAQTRHTVPRPPGRRISTRGGRFTLPTGEQSPGPIEAVILDWRNFNRYYASPYSPQRPIPPSCFAIAKEIAHLGPHEEAGLPQNPSCGDCPKNEWGSAASGTGKACRNTVRLAIAALDANEESEPMILVVSPTGLKAWAAYVNGLAASGLHPIEAKTTIAFDLMHSYPTLQFRSTGTHENLSVYWTLRAKGQRLLDTTPQ